jgi:hypothetical protein
MVRMGGGGIKEGELRLAGFGNCGGFLRVIGVLA